MSLSPRQFSLFQHAEDGTVQVPLFATPREVVASKPVYGDLKPSPRSADGFESLHSLKSRKVEESQSDFRNGRPMGGLYDSIAAEGVKKPIAVISQGPHLFDEPEAGPHLIIRDGHHRLFSALETRPDEHLLLDDVPDHHQVWKHGKPRRYPDQEHAS
jgi:hypothetical protein